MLIIISKGVSNTVSSPNNLFPKNKSKYLGPYLELYVSTVKWTQINTWQEYRSS